MYKKFVITSISISLGLYLIFTYVAFNHKMLYMNREYPMWLHIKDLVNSKSTKDYDLVLIGDSRAKAGFIPNHNGDINSLNLAIGGGTPIEGYYILKKMIDGHNAPTKIMFSYGPFHLARQDVYWNRTVKFNFLNRNEYKEIEEIATKNDDYKTLGDGHSYTDYYALTKYIIDLKNGVLEKRWVSNQVVLNDCEQSNGHYFFGRNSSSNGLNNETEKPSFIPSVLLDNYFKRLIDLAKENGIKLYYYTMPFNESSFLNTSNDYKNKYNEHIENLTSEYDIKKCNDLSFLTNDNFGDASHVFSGADVTTKEIFDCVSN